MKALFISANVEDASKLIALFKSNFPAITLQSAKDKESALNQAAIDGPFALTIVDVDDKNLTPDSIVHEMIDFSADRPFIFLGNQSILNDRLSDQSLNSHSLNDTLVRPVERTSFLKEFVEKIDKIIQFSKEKEEEEAIEEIDPRDFIPMKIKSFYLFKSFPYDLYLEITPTRFLKAISANEPYALSTLANYAKKNIRFLYIKKDDQLKYLEAESNKCLQGLNSLSHECDENILLLLRSVTLMHQTLLAIGITPTLSKLMDKAIDKIIEHFTAKESLAKITKVFPIDYSGIASKSLLTAYICLALCKKMKWDSDLTKRKLIFVAFIHDHTLPIEEMAKINNPNDKRLFEYSKEELDEFYEHPLKSSEIAKQFSGYSDIDFIIEAHHETPNRKGFPNKPSHIKLTSLCSVFNISQFVAAEVDGETIDQANLYKAARLLSRDYNQGNFKDPLKFLKDIVRNEY